MGYSDEVFWFDFESFDIYTGYIDVLNGMLALAEGSCLDNVTDIEEDTEDFELERGRGTISVSVTFDGEQYQWDNGQGAIVFFCTEDWARAFEMATGLEMERCFTPADVSP